MIRNCLFLSACEDEMDSSMNCSGRGDKEELEYDETLWTNEPIQQEPGTIRKWVSSESKEDGWCHVRSFVADPCLFILSGCVSEQRRQQ